MRNRIQDAFHKIQAEQALKDRTAAFAAEEIRRRSENRKMVPFRLPAVLAAVLVLFLTGVGFFRSYYTVSAAISVDADASLELGINCFDRVIAVEGYGEAGEALAEILDLQHQDYQTALETLLDRLETQEQPSEDNLVDITVTGKDTAQAEEILQETREDTAQAENIRCQAGNSEEMKTARESGLSFGKYQAYLQLYELDPSIEPQAVADLSMKQIREWIRELSQEEASEKEDSLTGGAPEDTVSQQPESGKGRKEQQRQGPQQGRGQGRKNAQ